MRATLKSSRKITLLLAAGAIALLATGAGCKRREAAVVDDKLSCFAMPEQPTGNEKDGWNPLLAGMPRCFETVAQCNAARQPWPAQPECKPLMRIKWHCTSQPSAAGDPLESVRICYPTRELCNVAREHTEGAGECGERLRVACVRAGGGQLTCYPDEASCDLAEAATAAALGGRARPCERLDSTR